MKKHTLQLCYMMKWIKKKESFPSKLSVWFCWAAMQLKNAKIKTLHVLSCPGALQFCSTNSKFNMSVTVGEMHQFIFSSQKHHESIY